MGDYVIKVSIIGDGNCLFRCFAHYLYNNQNLYHAVRLNIVDHMVRYWDTYSPFFLHSNNPILTAEDYRQFMGRNREYGGEPEIMCFVDKYSANVEIYIEDEELPRCYGVENATRKLYLVFSGDLDNGHYDIIYPPNSNIVRNDIRQCSANNKMLPLKKRKATSGNDLNKKKIKLESTKTQKISTSSNGYIKKNINKNIYNSDYGAMNFKCPHCSAVYWEAEKIKTICCHNGKITLPPLTKYPATLQKLLFDGSFRAKIRYYNNLFSFASFNGNIIRNDNKGVYNLKVQGQICHTTPTSLQPGEAQSPSYSQIYIYDDEDAITQRSSNTNVSKSHIATLTNILNKNTYAKKYKQLHELTKEKPLSNYKLFFERPMNRDKARYNKPSTAECALIITSRCGQIPTNIDLCVYPRHPPVGESDRKFLNMLSQHIDPMIFPLMFPSGDVGWSIGSESSTKKSKITAAQYYAFRLAYRPTLAFDPILKSGRLSQQYFVNSYVRVEHNRMNFFRFNQKQLRVECYQGIYDHVHGAATNNSENFTKEKLGNIYVLPSNYIGSPRYMQQNYMDAMAIVRRVGRPDLFITMTCNPQWPEIQRVLKDFPPGTTTNDIAPIIVRLFKTKLEALISYICNERVFGDVIAFVYTIEFQGRGLPHAHILFTLAPDSKLRTPKDIDKHISAEIPSDVDNELYLLVIKHMLHGPHNVNCPCFKQDQDTCSKNFPKSFCEETRFEVNGYPIYRRTDNRTSGHKYNKKVDGMEVSVDNTMVVPYNGVLLRKFQCHINVEYCASIAGMKYIFSYLNKGHDRAYMSLKKEGEDPDTFDEIKKYIDARYVGPMEGAWRLAQFSICGRSHAVQRLAIHTENQQRLVYEHNSEEAALINPNTTLTSWFALNQKDLSARQYKYIEIPEHYSFDNKSKTWKARTRDRNTIGRLCSVSPRDVERFHLKLILSRVKGALSFQHLKTYKGQIYQTYYEVAIAMGLIEHDGEIFNMFEEACVVMLPKALRKFFAWFLIAEGVVGDKIWAKFKNFFCEGFKESPEDHALKHISDILTAEDRTCAEFKLPEPNLKNLRDTSQLPNIGQYRDIFNSMHDRLTPDQKLIFDKIVCGPQRLFFVDGPGGSGKTYIYVTLINYFLSIGKKVLAMAWTGIAALLLPGGMTAHRTFRLPRDFQKMESCTLNSDLDKKKLREADVLFIDEGSMLPKKALEIIHFTLCDLCSNQDHFANKVIIIGGDFRQILPVVKFGSRSTIVAETIKHSFLWQYFQVIHLSQNIRSIDPQYSEFLLEIGNGTLINVDLKKWKVTDVCKEIYQYIAKDLDVLESVILTTHNKSVLMLNEKILDYLSGRIITYCSIDFARYKGSDTADPDIALDYDIAYLNSLNIPGLPQHELKLKIGAIVMLIRNLSINDGLCNGTRLKIINLYTYNIEAQIITGVKKGRIVFIPRIILDTGVDSNLPFILYRRQFPIVLAFAMTVNKSQGQSFNKVGLYLDRPFFSHGQLYVALSRCRDPKNLFIETADSSSETVENIVWPEILCEEL